MPDAAAFVPADLDAADWSSLEPLLRALLERPVSTRDDLERWLLDRSELDAACAEAEANLYIAMTCRTDDPDAAGAYSRYVETIPPRLKPLAFELNRRQVELSSRHPLDPARYAVLDRDTRADVELFRPENVPIETELALLAQRFGTIVGAMTVEFDGEERTLPQMARYQESPDRAVRRDAWLAVARRRAQDRDALDALFDDMVARRDRLARNAGFDSFTPCAFRQLHRFDYGVPECLAFHDACQRAVVPFMRRCDERRRARLGVDPLRPWDLAVDPLGRPPLRPFEGGADLVRRTARALERLDPRLAAMFARLGDGRNDRGPAGEGGAACLDLDSRKGKAPGGYQYMRDRRRSPFIFMNAAGLQRDVETMVHEAGHAFHSMLCEREPLVHYRHPPCEFAEVASMSMELLTMRHWSAPGSFYPSDADAARAVRQQIEKAVTILPWIACIDAFQHWIYAHPRHSRDQRADAWVALDERFGHAVSWEGLDDHRRRAWHRQPHLFSAPFYYIEYAIAQLGALQLWLVALDRSEREAVERYTRALARGGSRPLPELFAAAGLVFDFGFDTISRLVDRVERELDALPE